MTSEREDDATLASHLAMFGDPKTKLDSSEPEWMTLSISQPTETSYLTTTGMQAEGNNEPSMFSPSFGPQNKHVLPGPTEEEPDIEPEEQPGEVLAEEEPEKELEEEPKEEPAEELPEEELPEEELPEEDPEEMQEKPRDYKIMWNKYKCTAGGIACIICGVLLAVIGGLLFIPAHNLTYITSVRNETSNVTLFHVQPNPLVFLLAEFESENYSSFVSSIPNDTDFSCSIWVAESLRLNYHPYNNSDIPLSDDPYDASFYAQIGSIFNITFTFPLLTGSDSAYVQVNFSNYTGPGVNGRVFKSQLVKPSTNSPVIFSVDQSTAGFIELNIANYGLTGSFSYNITVSQPSLEQARYICTLNSTHNACQGMSVNDTNYVLAETTLETNRIMAVTLIGRRKREINSLCSVFGSVIIVFGILLVLVVILVLVYVHSKIHFIRSKYEKLDGIDTDKLPCHTDV